MDVGSTSLHPPGIQITFFIDVGSPSLPPPGIQITFFMDVGGYDFAMALI